MHIGSQLLALEPFRREVAASSRTLGEFPVCDLGGGLGVAYTEPSSSRRRSRSTSATLVARRARTASAPGKRLLIEPGRALVANAGVTLYTVETRQAQRLHLGRRRRRHVRQPAPDALRRRYEAHVADRFGGCDARACSRASTASPAT